MKELSEVQILGEAALEIGPEQLKIVGEYVRSHIGEWLDSGSPQDMILRERVIRVEEGIKNQLEMMRLGFEQVDKRFELMEKRFDQIDKRFEQVEKRFEQVDKRFEELRTDMNYRFEQVDKRFSRVYTFLSGIFITLLGGFVTVIIRLMQIG